MNAYEIQPTSCHVCGYEMDRSTAVQDDGIGPQEGDISVCIRCGAIGVFDANTKLREPTAKEMLAMQEDKDGWFDILRVQQLARRLKMS